MRGTFVCLKIITMIMVITQQLQLQSCSRIDMQTHAGRM